MEELINYLQQKGKSKSSITSYVRTCQNFVKWAERKHIAPEFMTYSELLDYAAYLKKKEVSQRTIRAYFTAITHYFEALVRSKIITTNPGKYLDMKSTPHKKLYQILNREQLENLYHHFDINAYPKTRSTAYPSAIRNKIAVGFMVFQGLDANALSQLKTEDIDVLGGRITVQSSRKHAARNLALQAVQIIELDRYINQTRKELQQHFNQEDSDLLLISGFTNYSDTLRNLFRRLRKQEPQLENAQHIRASVITHWLKQYNLREVQYMAGHRTVLSTESYQRNDTEGLQLDVDQFHPLG